ncbi:unnamed protein product [Mytilus edulis]|uniref:Retrotransposon gag domain-containing protein n=1 Tax=Mytilus edulis TaxID=6550 RepID=A0A8S3S1Q7_MYTED|nr:unnamed protein product [Mytilus edulis]
MESLATCSKFHGYPQDNGNKFLTEFESFSTWHGLSEFNLTDKRMLAAFHLHLKGPALTWYNSLSDESKSDWKSVRILLKEKYVTLCGHGANALMHSEIFQNLTLSSGQSLEVFIVKFLKRVNYSPSRNMKCSPNISVAYLSKCNFLFAQGCLKICKTPSLPQKWQKPMVIEDTTTLLMPQDSSKTNLVIIEEPLMIKILKCAICDNKFRS